MITVYWACVNPEWMRVEEPLPLYSEFIKTKSSESEYLRCPAVKEYLHNTFKLPALYECNFKLTEHGILGIPGQKNVDKAITLRSIKDRLVHLEYTFIFFTEEDSLEVSLFHPYLEDTYFSRNTTVIPGKLDIGKYFRTTDCGFHLSKSTDKLAIKERESFSYLKIHTEEEIELKQFRVNNTLINAIQDVLSIKEHRDSKYRYLSWYYNKFKKSNWKPSILQEIKNNLCN